MSVDSINIGGHGCDTSKKNKKIGILTLYYHNYNYGGLLQAYALCTFLRKQGYDAEQICFSKNAEAEEAAERGTQNPAKPSKIRFLYPAVYYRYFRRKAARFVDKTTVKLHKSNKLFLTEKIAKFIAFQESIPHSSKVYRQETIYQSCQIYDCFVVGSDQVWNLAWSRDAFFLDFVDKRCRKLSYAASFGNLEFSPEQLEYVREKLSSFNSLSVRENNARDFLSKLLENKAVEWVLDPTLLLDQTDWDKITTKRAVRAKYIFCFLFGEDIALRNLIKQYAKCNNLKIVNVGHVNNTIIQSDIGFGDYRFNCLSPNDFVSLIKYSECVFTNSFHATVFSAIYHKNFFVFDRYGKMNMKDRIYSLCEMLGCPDHFCDTEEKRDLIYIDGLERIDYQKGCKELSDARERSISYLLSNLQ